MEARTGGFSVRGYVEELVYQLGPLEIAAGVDLRYPEARISPYTAVIYTADRWWLSVEVARPWPGTGWVAALTGGLSW